MISNLGGNELSSVPEGLFHGLSNLSSMYVSPLFNLFDLMISFLANNQLTSVPEVLFHGLSNLQIIAMNDNQLSALPDNIFCGLPHLKNLYRRSLFNTAYLLIVS
jgi:Leucine-rich repeat (LRR) protein